MRALAFTGMPGSGKSEAVAVARAHGVPVVRMGDLVFEETRRQGLDLGRAGEVAHEARGRHGADVWARRTVERLSSPPFSEAPLVVVDGVRSLPELSFFREALGRSFVLVAVTAPDAVRHGRLEARGRSDAAEPAVARDERERGWGIEKAIARADVTIANDGPVDELRERIWALLSKELGPA